MKSIKIPEKSMTLIKEAVNQTQVAMKMRDVVVQSIGSALGVPDGYQLNFKTSSFEPAPKKE